jgi:hypothetical protein
MAPSKTVVFSEYEQVSSYGPVNRSIEIFEADVVALADVALPAPGPHMLDLRGLTTVSSTGGTAELRGSAYADSIYGTGAGEVIVGGGGDDSLDGGMGFDVARYSGSSVDYEIGWNVNGYVADMRSGWPDGADTLTSIDALQFSNRFITWTYEDTALTVSEATLLADDTKTILSVSQPINGTTVFDGTNVTYTPSLNFTGTDSFTYTMQDAAGAQSSATVAVLVNDANDAPVAVADSFTVNEDTPLTIPSASLLANDTDADADDAKFLVSVQGATNGTVMLFEGNAVFTPNADYNGPAGFTYTMEDVAGAQSTATVNVNVLAAAEPPQGPVLASQTLWGGSGDQSFQDVDYGLGRVYIAGYEDPTGDRTLAVAFNETNLSSAWIRRGAYNYGGEAFFDVAVNASNGQAIFAGIDWLRTTENVGGKEAKAVLDSLNAGNGNENWFRQADVAGNEAMYAYTGTEFFNGISAAVEGGSTYYYAVGAGEPFSYLGMAVLKYDANGNRVAAAPDPSLGSFSSPTYLVPGSSQAYDVVVANGKEYVAGYTAWSSQGDSVPRPDLWTFNTSLGLLNNYKDTTLNGQFNGVTSLNGEIYAVGDRQYSSGPTDYLIEKFDQNGALLWRAVTGTAAADSLQDVVAVGGRLFATGYTNGEGAGGYDAVLVEIDPANGSFISKTLFGSAADDRGYGLASDGANLFIAGESRSFAVGGNGTGQSDGLLLKYSVPAGQTITGTAGDDALVGSPLGDVITGGAGDDVLYGMGGADRYDYNASSDGHDLIVGFDPASGGDVLDIRDLLQSTPSESNIGDFVRLEESGGNTTVWVDADGSAAAADFAALATLQGVTELLLNDLLANGNLVVS